MQFQAAHDHHLCRRWVAYPPATTSHPSTWRHLPYVALHHPSTHTSHTQIHSRLFSLAGEWPIELRHDSTSSSSRRLRRTGEQCSFNVTPPPLRVAPLKWPRRRASPAHITSAHHRLATPARNTGEHGGTTAPSLHQHSLHVVATGECYSRKRYIVDSNAIHRDGGPAGPAAAA